tara:strand:+ start:6750 stop:7124 length:375 start_codon:yes stop_codon:yes gene_type:complete
MELGVIMFMAIFTMIFGQIFLARIVDLAFNLMDKAIDNAGNLVILPFRIAAMVSMFMFKVFVLAIKGIVHLIPSKTPELESTAVHTVVQTVEVTPYTLQHLRNQRFLNAPVKVRSGLLIEQSPD